MKKSGSKAPSSTKETSRLNERLAISVPVAIRGFGRAAAIHEQTTTLDLSQGGASFLSRKPYRPGMTLRISFPDAQGPSGGSGKLAAEVVRVKDGPAGSGQVVAIRFKDARLANPTLVELLRSKIRASAALLDILQAGTAGTKTEDVIQAICRMVEKAMDSERALLFLRDAPGGPWRARLSASGRIQEFQIAPGPGLAATGAGKLTGAPGRAGIDPELEKKFISGIRSALRIPLEREGGAPEGQLAVFNKRFGPFTDEDERLGTAVARQISIVLRGARLFEDISNVKNYNEGILESIASSVFTFNRAGELATVNRAASELAGSDAARLQGINFGALFNRSVNPRLFSVVEDAVVRQRRRAAYDIRFVRGDGASFSLNVSAFPLRDVKGNSLGAVLVADDITQEQRLLTTFSRYVAREVAEQVLENQGAIKLGGTRTDVTILIADIRNFTSMSERMDPEDVVSLLNSYYPRIINAVFRHQGMLDKFIGDAVLAVFGVPVPRPDDALRATRAALEIRRDLAALNRERNRSNQLAIEIGIGITSGAVISGNIGSERRMDYTVIGDPVNLAARLEGLTKEVDRRILVNERVRDAIEKEIACEALGMFKVKGKQEEVAVFAVKTPV